MFFVLPRSLLLVLLFLCTPHCSPLSLSLPPSATYLLQFRDSLPEPSRSLLTWNLSDRLAPCSWAGVSCYSGDESAACGAGKFKVKALNFTDNGLSGDLNRSIVHICRHESILSLDLSGNHFTGKVPELLGSCGLLRTIQLNVNELQGTVPHEIFQSEILSELDLSYNSLNGTIPPEVSQAKNLARLEMGFNALTGKIPLEVTRCEKLEYLGLYNNFLSGEIPKDLFAMPNLRFLYLNTNNFSGVLPNFPPSCAISELWIHENEFFGSFPVTFKNCKNITRFFASVNKFTGNIPEEAFEGLLQLQVIRLDENRLEGEIPETLWDLENLQELILSENKLSGSISVLVAQCRWLSKIVLHGNNLVGRIPSSMGSLQYLTVLTLSENELQGPLPPEIGNCTLLIELELQDNLIGGTIPPELCKLVDLEIFDLFNNRLEGHIPQCIGQMRSLVELALFENNLIGTIPAGIALLKNLTFLSLAHNNLTGIVPPELGKNSPGLEKVDLEENGLRGMIPSGLCDGNKLKNLILSRNQFNGSFPPELEKCSSLQRLILSNNLLQGNMAENLFQNSGIYYFDVRGNLLSGRIPPMFGYLRNLSMLDISENKLSGSIPPQLGKMENLQVLRISSNRLTGSIPTDLGHLQKLIKLDLSKNSLSGSIPSEVIGLTQLQNLQLQENNLTGTIPDTFSPSQSLFELQLGSNILEGPIPCSLSRLQHFSLGLNLSNNRLSGKIPGCLGSLDKLESLDLSRNHFFGKIPPQVDNMKSISFLNISFNNLSGKIPETWLKLVASDPESSVGNPQLCILGTQATSCAKAKRHRPSSGLLAGTLVVVILCVAILGAAVCFAIQRRRPRDLSLLHDSRSGTEELPEDLNFQDIMRAMEDLSNNVIGKGKHGTVYRMESLNTKRQWAVKKVDLSDSNFSMEMRTLGSVRHRNVVKMAGHCIKDGFGFIVTEYMPAGTLFDVLHRRKPLPVLNWDVRYKIALGIAQGLSYLHHDCVPQIIHRDIKSDNIFMDSDLEPKIGDFGVAKLVCEFEVSSTKSSIVGTLGYIAPENGYSIRLTEKSDVYSYGVILLELLCRKMPIDPCFEEGLDIVLWTKQNLQNSDEYVSFLDKEISFWHIEDQRKALKLRDLALQCTDSVADARPSMRDVVVTLTKLNKKNR